MINVGTSIRFILDERRCDLRVPYISRSLTSRCTGADHGCFFYLPTLFRPPRELDIIPLICFYSYIRMMPVVTSVRGAHFVKDTLVGLITVLPVFITAHELVLKTNVFRFLVSTRCARLAGSVIKPLHNQPLHGSGLRSLFVLTQTVSPAP